MKVQTQFRETVNVWANIVGNRTMGQHFNEGSPMAHNYHWKKFLLHHPTILAITVIDIQMKTKLIVVVIHFILPK